MHLLYRKIRIMYHMSTVQGAEARQAERGAESILIHSNHSMPAGHVLGLGHKQFASL